MDMLKVEAFPFVSLFRFIERQLEAQLNLSAASGHYWIYLTENVSFTMALKSTTGV